MYFVCSSRSTHGFPTFDLHWSVGGRTKISTEVDMWRRSDSLNFLRAEDFGRTRPLSVSAFPRVGSSMAFERRDDRADCVRDTVNRVGRRRWKWSSVALSAAASATSIERMAWAFIDYEERGISTTFVGWLLCDFNRCPKLRKFVEKIQTMVNERSIDGANLKKSKWRKTKISTHLLLGETLRGRLVMSKKSLNAVQKK